MKISNNRLIGKRLSVSMRIEKLESSKNPNVSRILPSSEYLTSGNLSYILTEV